MVGAVICVIEHRQFIRCSLLNVAFHEFAVVGISDNAVFKLEAKADPLFKAEKRDRIHLSLAHRMFFNDTSIPSVDTGAVDRADDFHGQIVEQTGLQKCEVAAGVDHDLQTPVHCLVKILSQTRGDLMLSCGNDRAVDIADNQFYIFCVCCHL